MPRGRPPKAKASGDKDKVKEKVKAKAKKEESDDEVKVFEDEEEDDEMDKVKDKEDVAKGDDEGETALPASDKFKGKMIWMADGLGDDGLEHLEQFLLPHPVTGHDALFLVDMRQGEERKGQDFIAEVMTMEEEDGGPECDLVDDAVVSDGRVYTATKMDPIVFLIPLMMKARHAMTLRDLLYEWIKSPELINVFIFHLNESQQIENISKKIVNDDIIAYKWEEGKALKWGIKKANKGADYFEEQGISGSETAVSANFNRISTLPREKQREEYLRYSCETFGEYLPEELKRKLFEKLGLPLAAPIKRKSVAEAEGGDGAGGGAVDDDEVTVVSSPKKLKVSNRPTEDYGSDNPPPPKVVPVKVTAKELAMKKAAIGTPSISSFFGKKPK